MTAIAKIHRNKDPLAFIHEGFVTFTPAQAKYVFDHCRYEKNRNENQAKGHIELLRRQMMDGTWLPKGQIDFAQRPDGSLTLVNGHHRMLAQADSGVDIQWAIVIHECSDDEEIAGLFWRIDTVMRKRSTNNVLDAASMAERLGVSKLSSRSLARAVSYIHGGMRKNQGSERAIFTPAELISAMLHWDDEIVALDKLITSAPERMRRKLCSAQVMSVALVTLRHAPVPARDFWGGIAEDDGLKRGDPRKTLLDYIRESHLGGGGFTGGAVAATRAWNAHVAGRDLTVIRIGTAAVKIAGSDVVVRP